ncbi:MAG: hypothetical protein IJM18_06975 [Clostridia bacterium]|nr:hypothetical protein [Clostridia bacterium]
MAYLLLLLLLFASFYYESIKVIAETTSNNDQESGTFFDSHDFPDALSSDYNAVTITVPDNTTVHAYKYTGNSTPVSGHPDAASFGATVVTGSASSYYYNCHGFAWYFCGKTTGITNSKAFWVNSPGVDDIKSTDCYSYVNGVTCVKCNELTQYKYRSKLAVGDIVVYLNDIDDRDSNSKYKHSAVIVSISSTEILVHSKWDEYPVYEHSVPNCPYSLSMNPNSLGEYCKVTVYRATHFTSGTVYVNNSLVPTLVSASHYSFPKYISYNDSKHKTLCDCGRAYKLQSHNYVHLSGTRYKCSNCGHLYDSGVSPDNG